MENADQVNNIGNILKVGFFVGNEKLIKRENFKHSKLDDAGDLYIDLKDEKDRAVLDVMLRIDKIHIDGYVYKVASREYVLEGTGIFISLEKI
jgi:hypothetical protein